MEEKKKIIQKSILIIIEDLFELFLAIVIVIILRIFIYI